MAKRRRKSSTLALEGADDLIAALRAIGARASGLTLNKAAKAGAEVIRAEAQRLAPRDSGDLAEGITAEAREHTLRGGRAQVDISHGKAEWYGGLVETGTKNMAAQPYLRPALDAKQQEASKAVRDVLYDALKHVLD